MEPVTMMLLSAAAGAGVGGLKGALVDRPRAQAMQRYEKEVAPYGYRFGRQPQYVHDPGIWGSLLQGLGTGAAMGQQFALAGAKPAAERGAAQTKFTPTSPEALALTEETPYDRLLAQREARAQGQISPQQDVPAYARNYSTPEDENIWRHAH